jgi:hypothetical protein
MGFGQRAIANIRSRVQKLTYYQVVDLKLTSFIAITTNNLHFTFIDERNRIKLVPGQGGGKIAGGERTFHSIKTSGGCYPQVSTTRNSKEKTHRLQ